MVVLIKSESRVKFKLSLASSWIYGLKKMASTSLKGYNKDNKSKVQLEHAEAKKITRLADHMLNRSQVYAA